MPCIRKQADVGTSQPNDSFQIDKFCKTCIIHCGALLNVELYANLNANSARKAVYVMIDIVMVSCGSQLARSGLQFCDSWAEAGADLIMRSGSKLHLFVGGSRPKCRV